MADELAFVIPGIYISKVSKNSPNDDAPKEFIRVLGESDDKENYFKLEDGRELPEYVILNDFELYSTGYSENYVKSSTRKSKHLMRDFKPTQKQEKDHSEKITKQKPEQNEENIVISDSNKNEVSSDKKDDKNSNFWAGKKIFVTREELPTAEIFVPNSLTDFEKAVLNQFIGKIESTVNIPSFKLLCNVNFSQLGNAIKMFGLNKQNIAKTIAESFINNPMFYETLSKVLEDLLDIDLTQSKNNSSDKIEEQQNTEKEEVTEEIFEEKITKEDVISTEEKDTTNSDNSNSEIQTKLNSVDEYLKSHNLI